MTQAKGTVGIVGVGNMGGGMAGRLLECGWRVQVRDIVDAKMQALVREGALAATSPREAATSAQALIVAVVTAQQAADVLFGADGAAQVLPRGSAVLLCPTIAPADVERLAAGLAERGLRAIDAPMSGGPQRARDGTMSLMVACEDAVFEANRALLETLSGKLFRVGTRIGDGARTKLVNNLVAGINLVAAAEGIAMAERLGLDPARTLDVIEQSSGQSWVGTDRMRRAIAGDFAPRAHVTLLQKDTGLALQAARAAGFEPVLGPVAHEAFNRSVAAGDAELDDAVLLRLYRGK
jgi:L-threonate 2-dehydrogenase